MKTSNLHLSKIKFLGLVTILVIISVFTAMGARAQITGIVAASQVTGSAADINLATTADDVQWFTANSYQVAWDPVTARTDGEPIGATDTIKYNIYVVDETDIGKEGPLKVGDAIEVINHTITLSAEGSFWVGVEALRFIEDGTQVSKSIIAWSDNPAYTSSGQKWGIRFYLPPAAAQGIGPQN